MNVDHPSFVGISLCSGVGMLDEGIRLAFPGALTACYVEWESYAQACLLARMEEASLEPAPIWSDTLESFPAEQFAGCIDWLSAGFPCQPHSCAGKRQGIADERWIWESIADIIRRVEPRFVFLENVRGLLSSSNGSAFAAVLRDLALLGFDVEWTVLRASEVGASHQRARLFILAYRTGERLGETRHGNAKPSVGIGRCGSALAHGEGERRNEGRAEPSRIEWRPDVAKCCSPMADAGIGFISEQGRQAQRGTGVEPAGTEHVGESDSGREWNHETGSFPREDTWGSTGGSGRFMADASGPGSQGSELEDACDRDRRGPDAHGSVAQLCGPCVFAPGPQSGLWPDILIAMPHFAPAIKPGVRLLADGVAYVVDQTRADALRCAGNGVVALQAAAAFTHLAGRLTCRHRRDAH
ncbi:MAG: DNA cytosine methyltransferase [Chthoniobacteraceae bacterium]